MKAVGPICEAKLWKVNLKDKYINNEREIYISGVSIEDIPGVCMALGEFDFDIVSIESIGNCFIPIRNIQPKEALSDEKNDN